MIIAASPYRQLTKSTARPLAFLATEKITRKDRRKSRARDVPRDGLPTIRMDLAGYVKVVTRHCRKSHVAAFDFLSKTAPFLDLGRSAEFSDSSVDDSLKTTPGKALLKAPARWADSTEKTQVTYYARYQETQSNFRHVFFTLRVNQRLFLKQPDPASWLLKRINKSLKKLGAKNFRGVWFVLHVGPENRPELHAHGVVSVVASVTNNALSALLKAAGGDWRSGPASGVQVRLKDMYDADGAVQYAMREHKRVRAFLLSRSIAIDRRHSPAIAAASLEVRRGAQRLYQEHRRKLFPARKTKRRMS